LLAESSAYADIPGLKASRLLLVTRELKARFKAVVDINNIIDKIDNKYNGLNNWCIIGDDRVL
jgi:hypothetical protein